MSDHTPDEIDAFFADVLALTVANPLDHAVTDDDACPYCGTLGHGEPCDPQCPSSGERS